MLATPGAPDVQVPPELKLNKVVLEPTQVTAVPDIGTGNAFTVRLPVLRQPVASVYVIVALPAETPVASPDVLIVATPLLLLAQVPPPSALLSVVVLFTHTLSVPAITDGNALTVNEAVLRQPVLNVYEIVAMPGVIPVTTPEASTNAVPGAPLSHVPPGVLLDNTVIVL